MTCLCIAALLAAATLTNDAAPVDDHLLGDWAGAYVRSDSVLRVNVRFERADDGTLQRREEYPDWIWYGWLDPAPVTIADDGRIVMSSRYGEARLTWDIDVAEMIGPSGAATPPVTLHLKRVPPRPEIRISERPALFGPEPALSGTLILPEGDGPHACVVMLHGRGCAARGLYRDIGRALARYGVASLAYDKRGAGSSPGDCDLATHASTVDDAMAALAWAREQPEIDAARTGVLGTSAGAWTAQGVAARSLAGGSDLPAFIITWIGPSTSVLEQQVDAARAIGEGIGLTESQVGLALRVLEISMDRAADPDARVAALQAARAQAREEGWLDRMFEPSDFVDDPAGLDRLWINRFRFDPTSALAALSETPYLSVLGETDLIVPYEINAGRLRALLDRAGNEQYKIVGLPGVGHSFEHGDLFRVIERPGPDVSYMSFDRVQPGFYEATVRFLRELGCATR